MAAQPQPLPVFPVTDGLHALLEAGYLSEAILSVKRNGLRLLAPIICVAPARVFFLDWGALAGDLRLADWEIFV